jgi:hypothetical protein
MYPHPSWVRGSNGVQLRVRALREFSRRPDPMGGGNTYAIVVESWTELNENEKLGSILYPDWQVGNDKSDTSMHNSAPNLIKFSKN